MLKAMADGLRKSKTLNFVPQHEIDSPIEW
jgi:hypothetical protein